jgi:hypothetical protein
MLHASARRPLVQESASSWCLSCEVESANRSSVSCSRRRVSPCRRSSRLASSLAAKTSRSYVCSSLDFWSLKSGRCEMRRLSTCHVWWGLAPIRESEYWNGTSESSSASPSECCSSSPRSRECSRSACFSAWMMRALSLRSYKK